MARDDLFSAPVENQPEEKPLPAPENFRNQPLAARMRPRNLDEYAGQTHISRRDNYCAARSRPTGFNR